MNLKLNETEEGEQMKALIVQFCHPSNVKSLYFMFVVGDGFSTKHDKEAASDMMRAMLLFSGQATENQADLDDLLTFLLDVDLTKSCLNKTGKLLKTVNQNLL